MRGRLPPEGTVLKSHQGSLRALFNCRGRRWAPCEFRKAACYAFGGSVSSYCRGTLIGGRKWDSAYQRDRRWRSTVSKSSENQPGLAPLAIFFCLYSKTRRVSLEFLWIVYVERLELMNQLKRKLFTVLLEEFSPLSNSYSNF